MHALLVLFEIERVAFRVVLALMCVRLLRSTWLARSRDARPSPLVAERLPTITVQIPVKNELFVVERVMRAAAAMTYPRERLDIQVIDQSDDGTTAVIGRVARDLVSSGTRVSHLRRAPEDGAKSESLAFGLARSASDCFAVLDADCVPPADFLLRLLPHFRNDVGLVQASLAFENRDAALVTRTQAQLLDGLMLVEQAAESSRAGGMVQFNGTAGIWRRECIVDAGGWLAGAIAEDLDLSCRAIAAGWRLVHVPDVRVAALAPETMSAFRAQQRRWTRGHMHVARRELLSRARGSGSGRAPLSHVMRRGVFVFIAFMIITWPLTTFGVVAPLVRYTTAHDVALFACTIACASAFLLRGQARAGRSLAREALLLPFSWMSFIGISIACAASTLAALSTSEGKFARTPKNMPNRDTHDAPAYSAKLDALVALEIAIAIAYAALAILAARRGLVLHAAWSVLVAASFGWVGGGAASELRTVANDVPHRQEYGGIV